MEHFTGHRIIQSYSGDILVLYVDFKTEFAKTLGVMDKEDEMSLKDKVHSYASKYISDKKLVAAHIVSGSLLLATLSMVGAKSFYAESPRHLQKNGSKESAVQTTSGALADESSKMGTSVKSKPFREQRPTEKDTLNVEKSIGANPTMHSLLLNLDRIGYGPKEDTAYDVQETVINFQKRYPEIKADGTYNQQTKLALEKLAASDFKIINNPSDILALVNKNHSLPYYYEPDNLVVPNIPFTFEGFLPQKQLRDIAAKALEELFAKAEKDHIRLYAVSGYRSYDRQAEIFDRNSVKSENANMWSARPGESEHQTGLSMDVTSSSVDYRLTQTFGGVKEGKWLARHVADFGYIIRYPEGREHVTEYQYEPWHIRFVGKEAAKEITGRQITLEEYLVY